MPTVVMYTANRCPYCTMAKNLLARKGVSVTEINVDSAPGLRDEMVAKTKRRTVPQIFIGERHIGGCDDLYALDRQQQLDDLLQDVAD